MKKAAGWMGLLAIALGQAGGATEWKAAGAMVDTVVADSTDLPPPSILVPVAARIPFKNFRYPHVDAKENVTFIADDPVYGGNAVNHGIYRSYAANGNLESLVRAGETPIPGGAAVITLVRGLQMADNLSDFVFWAYDDKKRTGIYYWKNYSLELVARTGETVLPGALEPIRDVEYAASSEGRILYVAEDATGRRLVVFDPDARTHRTLVSMGEPVPSQPGEVFRYLSPQNWISGSNVVFRGARTPNPRTLSTSGEGHRGIYFIANATTEGVEPPTIKRLVDWKTEVPGLPGRRFTDLRSAPVLDGNVAFVGAGPEFEGLYWMETGKGKLHSVIDTTTSLESLFEGTFTGFSIFPALLDGAIAVVATADDGYAGIFLFRMADDTLFLLTDNRTPIDGRKAQAYEIAGHCLIGNRLAVKADFEDGSSGVYLATIPERGFLRVSKN